MSPPAPERRPPHPADTPAEVVISRELVPGEHLIWSGRPPRGIEWSHAIVAVGTLAFDLFLAVNVGGPFVILWNGITTAAALQHAFTRLALTPRRRRRTWYGVTSERVVVAVLVRGGIDVESVPLASVGVVRLVEQADGSGEIELLRPMTTRLDRRNTPAGRLATLELTADARRVYNLIRDARRAATANESRAERSPVLVESE